jgi:methionyl aminopeptidase
MIRSEGASPAFPCNLSINEVAAHYSPVIGDSARIPEGAVVKIDVGVHVDGYIADTALTIDLSGEHQDLINAAREALHRVIGVIQPGMKLRDIGSMIERTMKYYGCKPIRNLSGHNLGRYIIHAGMSIPNYHNPLIMGRIKPGDVVAIEPFATKGAGTVINGDLRPILAVRRTSVKGVSSTARRVFSYVYSNFKTLPFSERWLLREFGQVEKLRAALSELVRRGVMHAYPVLIEAEGGLVSQFEHTVLVLDKEVVVTTMPGS